MGKLQVVETKSITRVLRFKILQNYVNKKEMNDLYERKIVNQEKSKLL